MKKALNDADVVNGVSRADFVASYLKVSRGRVTVEQAHEVFDAFLHPPSDEEFHAALTAVCERVLSEPTPQREPS